MAANETHLDNIGTTFKLTVKDAGTVVDISSATTLNVIFVKPGGTTLTKTGVLVSDGTDGIMKYVTISGDLNEVGTWQLQGKVTFTSATYYSDIHTFKVHRNL
jgi:hypothetical protein